MLGFESAEQLSEITTTTTTPTPTTPLAYRDMHLILQGGVGGKPSQCNSVNHFFADQPGISVPLGWRSRFPGVSSEVHAT
jgi:hypothetical protein